MKVALNARSLRFVLLAILLLVLALGVTVFSYSYSLLKKYTAETSALNARAEVSDINVRNLRKLQAYLASNADEVHRAHDIVAESKMYQYQDDIIRDISSYAAQSGLTIVSYVFTPTASASGDPAAESSGTAQQTTPASQVGGAKSTTAQISIKSPVEYSKLLQFIQRIENNPMKMQIGSVAMSRAVTTDQKPGFVSADTFTIEVYIR